MKEKKAEEEGENLEAPNPAPNDLDVRVQKSLARGKLQPVDEIKLVMQIKSQVDKSLAQKQILAKMAMHLKNVVLERNEMQNIIDDTDALLNMDICELRAQNNFLYRKCLEITQSRSFDLFIAFCIIANTAVLAMDSYPSHINLLIFIEWANLIFFIAFVFEMIIKMLGLGLKIYFKDHYNTFDFIVIVFSVADLVFLYLST